MLRCYRNFGLAAQNVVKLHDVNLVGRDLVAPKNLTGAEIKSLLWTAMDLKHLSKQRCELNQQVKGARITLLADKPCVSTQLPLQNAAHLLGAQLSVFVDDKWNEFANTEDLGRAAAQYSDLIFCKCEDQEKIQLVADGASVPVISVGSSEFELVKVLAHLMTVQLYYNHLRGLKLAWVGAPCALLSTYVQWLPPLGVDVRYHCGGEALGPLGAALRASQRHNTELHECGSVEDAVYRGDVISAGPALRVTARDVAEAAVDWTLVHETGPGGAHLDRTLREHPNCLTWRSARNARWVLAATLLRFLSGHGHVTGLPTFDDIELRPHKLLRAV